MGHDLNDEELRATREDFFKKGKKMKIEPKTADEMFEKLGYEKEVNYTEIITYVKENKNNETMIAITHKGNFISKGILCKQCFETKNNVNFTKEEIIAVYEKIKEKGWL